VHEIGAIFHYIPLHSSPAGRRYGRTNGELPVTDAVSERLVRLPLWIGLEDEVIAHICGALAAFFR
jgi:dTDP-4-amino-4,6-dideoxygalactose transaminase